jgi:hypothetical protein
LEETNCQKQQRNLQQQRNYCTRFEQNPKGKNLSVVLLSRLFTAGYGVRDGAEPRSGRQVGPPPGP